MIVPIAMSYVGDLAPEGEEGRYMGFLNIALFSGIGSGPIIGGVFLDTFGASSAFYAMSSLSAASMLLVLTMLPPDRARGDGMTVALIPTFRRMIRSARVMGILFSRMTSMIVMVPTMAFLPLLMAEFMDASGAQIGLVIATRTLTNAALQTPFGGLVDRHDRVRLLLIGSGVMTAAMAAIPLAGGMPQLLLLFGTLGAGEAIVWPVLGALATEEGRVYGQGSMMGVFNMAMSAGIFLGALGAGWIVDTFSIGGAFVGVAVVVGASAVVSVVLIRREPSPTAPALRAANDARHAARM
jgi:MFS family permease